MTPDAQHETMKQTLIAAPSLGAIVVGWLDVPLATWSIRLGMAFIALQAGYLVWKWRRDVIRERERIRCGAPPPDTDKADL